MTAAQQSTYYCESPDLSHFESQTHDWNYSPRTVTAGFSSIILIFQLTESELQYLATARSDLVGPVDGMAVNRTFSIGRANGIIKVPTTPTAMHSTLSPQLFHLAEPALYSTSLVI